MPRFRLGYALAAIVVAVTVLVVLEALSMPVPARKQPVALVATWFVLLLVHAAAYRFGDRIRARYGIRGYAALQGVLVFALGASRIIPPVSVAIFMAMTVELVILAGPRWGTIRITLGAIGLYVIAALIASDLYRAVTAGLILAATGLVAHAVAALLQRPAAVPDLSLAPVIVSPPSNGTNGLSAREVEVLRELASGARNNDIALRLGISERTVKSHLGSIYQKLGVESRSAAVAAAMQRKLV
ncbi:MAG: response regulator transcription factor [Gemmatimonadaceae bacterium]